MAREAPPLSTTEESNVDVVKDYEKAGDAHRRKIMPIGTRYSVSYVHKRKEVVVEFQVGSMPPFHIVMGAEAFCQDFDAIVNNEGLAKYLAFIKEKKDLPIDHDFGAQGGDKRFNPKEWEDKMGGSDDKEH